MQGLKIGHTTNEEHGTGVSVFLFEEGATGAYLICGSAPASHELAVLDPENSVPHLFGLVLSGGSAFGLFSAQGVVTYLAEKGIGHPTVHGNVPIVPAAAIYDLSYKTASPPTAHEAYQACINAHANNTESGRIGAGTGATIGKIIPHKQHMSGGLGRAELTLTNGVNVIVYVVVNAIGDIYNNAGEIIAGSLSQDGAFADCASYLLSGKAEEDLFTHANSTLALVLTNAKFSKDELKRIGKMAIAGMARAVSPVFTRYDGDIMFCVSLGNKQVSELTIGTLAAQAVQAAIMDAVSASEVV